MEGGKCEVSCWPWCPAPLWECVSLYLSKHRCVFVFVCVCVCVCVCVEVWVRERQSEGGAETDKQRERQEENERERKRRQKSMKKREQMREMTEGKTARGMVVVYIFHNCTVVFLEVCVTCQSLIPESICSDSESEGLGWAAEMWHKASWTGQIGPSTAKTHQTHHIIHA